MGEGGGVFLCKDTWGCTTRKGILLWTSTWQRVYFRQIQSGQRFSFGNLVKEQSNFGNSCIETRKFDDFSLEKAKIGNFVLKAPLHGTFDVE